MRKILMMLSFALIVGACSKSDDGETAPPPKSQMTVNGETKEIKGHTLGFSEFSSCCLICSPDFTDAELGEDSYDSSSWKVVLDFTYPEQMSESFDLSYDLTKEDDLKEDDRWALVVKFEDNWYRAVCSNNEFYTDGDDLHITAGTLRCKYSGGRFILDFDITFDDGVNIKLKYDGTPAEGEYISIS